MDKYIYDKIRNARGELRGLIEQLIEDKEVDMGDSGFHTLIELIDIISGGDMLPYHAYRGVTNADYKLTPKIARVDPFLINTLQDIDSSSLSATEQIINLETRLLNDFRVRAVPFYTSNFKPKNLLEWYALAQHYELPTRFLDWTRNPLVALYFAVRNESDCDSALYFFQDTHLYEVNPSFGERGQELHDYFKNNVELIVYTPPHISPRISAQAALFTICKDPTRDFWQSKNQLKSNLYKITIPKQMKEWKNQEQHTRGLRRNDPKYLLYRYGIHEFSLIPDLDGLSSFLEWTHTRKY